MTTASIKQTATFNASPKEVYELLMDPKKHAAFTGAKATMKASVGGAFSTYDGYCHGRNIELVPGKKIVQEWHFAEPGWPEDHFSLCTFELGSVNGKTKLKFSQTGAPKESIKALTKGWKEFYWEPMAAYLKEVSS